MPLRFAFWQLEERGEIDWVGDRQPERGTVALDDSLVGTMLEVRWRYYHKETGKPVYIWCTGEVMQVSDGGVTKRTARCKNILPLGAVRCIVLTCDQTRVTKHR